MGILLSTLFILIGTGLGVLTGWWLRGNDVNADSTAPPQPEQPQDFVTAHEADPAVEIEDDPSSVVVEEMVTRLQRLTATVAADVGEHTTRVKAINQELCESENDGDTVLLVLEKLIDANGEMQGQLHAAENRLQEQTKQLDCYIKDARTDSLTHLANRRAFDDELNRCVELYQNNGAPVTVMMVDVDHFKSFNDSYGHQAGDEVLRGVARTLNRSVPPDAMVCRYGGEEFSVIFPGKTALQCKDSGEAARAAISGRRFKLDWEEVTVTASAGLAEIESGETGVELVKRADDALYYSKQAGRDCGHFQHGEICQLIAPALDLADSLAYAGDLSEEIRGVSDRESFEDAVERRLAAVKRGKEQIAVLLVKVDQFEQLKLDRGEEAGRIVQRATAQFLRSSMRDTDSVAYYGDNTFALLIPDTSLEETGGIAERVRSAIDRCSLPVMGSEVSFSVSLGAGMAETTDDLDSLLQRAEQELREVVEAGGNEVRIAACGSRC